MNHETRKTGTSQRLTRLGIPTALAMLVLPTVALGNAVQWTEAEGGNGHWYAMVTVDDAVTWFEADVLAQMDEAAHLVTCTSAEENDFVRNTWVECQGDPLTSQAWLGLYKGEAGSFTWVTGEPLVYDDWVPGDPNDGSPNAVAQFYHSMSDGCGWADSASDDTLNSFVIEWSADCNGDGIVDYGQILDGTFEDANDNGVPDTCEAIQWRVEDGGNGHWYSYRLGDLNNAAWTALAEAEGAHLVTITSEAEGVFVEAVHDAAAPQSSYHTGGFQDTNACEPGGGWRWVTGEPWQYTNWGYSDGADQPDDLPDYGEGANVMGIRWQENGIWLDAPETTEWAAMFEWSADCNGDGIVDYGQILDGTYPDTNGNGVPDCCDAGEPCDDFVRGACCLGTMCVLTTASDCFDASGSYAGDGVSCTEGLCGEPCPGDIDGNGIVDVIDILTVLNSWGVCP